MFDFGKRIFGETYTEEQDKQLAAEIGKGFVARADYNSVNENKKQLEAQIAERDKQLDELKKVDAAGLQAKITELQDANKAAQKAHADEIAKTKKEFTIEARLLKEGAVSTKAVRALLDDAKIVIDGENVLGLDEQLKSLRETEKWAFQPAAGKKGSLDHTGDGKGNAEPTKESEMLSKLYGR